MPARRSAGCVFDGEHVRGERSRVRRDMHARKSAAEELVLQPEAIVATNFGDEPSIAVLPAFGQRAGRRPVPRPASTSVAARFADQADALPPARATSGAVMPARRTTRARRPTPRGQVDRRSFTRKTVARCWHSWAPRRPAEAALGRQTRQARCNRNRSNKTRAGPIDSRHGMRYDRAKPRDVVLCAANARSYPSRSPAPHSQELLAEGANSTMDVRHYRTDLFPEIEPYASGMLPLGGSHDMYWEQAGNPRGTPVLFLHGGPGAGAAAAHRRFFDPRSYRIIIFDQRGCGRSRPHGETADNTTPNLVADMEVLRRHLNVRRWILFGGSWGSTLAFAYGIRWPEHCAGFVLRGIFLGTRQEVSMVSVWHGHLLSGGMAKLRPGVAGVRALGPPDQLSSPAHRPRSGGPHAGGRRLEPLRDGLLQPDSASARSRRPRSASTARRWRSPVSRRTTSSTTCFSAIASC